MSKQELKATAQRAVTRARKAAEQTRELVLARTDAVLVEAGRAAQRRQRGRAMKATLKAAGKAVLVAGATAATVALVRASMRHAKA